MRKQPSARDKLYDTLDELIRWYSLNLNKDLSAISLSSAQYQVFKDFNEPEAGVYFYRNVFIREVGRL